MSLVQSTEAMRHFWSPDDVTPAEDKRGSDSCCPFLTAVQIGPVLDVLPKLFVQGLTGVLEGCPAAVDAVQFGIKWIIGNAELDTYRHLA